VRTNTKGSKTIEADKKLLDIVEHLDRTGGARVTEIAAELDLSKSAVHAHLATLKQRGYVVADGDTYQLGVLFLNLGSTARNRVPFYSSVRPRIDRLADQTGERAQFVVEEHGLGFVVYRSWGEYAVQVEPQIGEPTHLHANASGKAILSALSDDDILEIIDHWGLPERTKHTITDRDALFEELDEIRERGYAINRGESRVGFHALGAPLQVDGSVIGSITVSGPQNRMADRPDEDLLDHLLGIINELELNASV